MNNAIDISRMRDPSFTAEVEAQSGQKVSTCYQCGNCTAGCPAGFVYDRQVNQIMRGVQLGLKDQVLNSRSLWMCLSCSTCSLRCPNDIDVAAVMETLRHMARKEGRVTVPKVEKFWFSFLDTVRRCILCYALPDEQSPQTFLKRVRETESDAVYDFVLQETQDILSRFPQH